MVVTSIDRLAPYRVSADLVLELVNVAAIIKTDPEESGKKSGARGRRSGSFEAEPLAKSSV